MNRPKNPYDGYEFPVEDAKGIMYHPRTIYEQAVTDTLEMLKKDGIPNDVYQNYLRGAMLAGDRLSMKQPYTYYGKKGHLVFIEEEKP